MRKPLPFPPTAMGPAAGPAAWTARSAPARVNAMLTRKREDGRLACRRLPAGRWRAANRVAAAARPRAQNPMRSRPTMARAAQPTTGS